MQDRTQGEVESALQIKGIEGGAGLAELFLGGGVHVRTGQEPVAGCHRAIMAAFDFRSVTVLAQEFGRRTKVVVERFPDVPVEGVDLLAQGGVFEPVVAEQLPNVRPVLLFHMAVVVFVVRP